MISYRRGGVYALLNVFKLKGSVFPQSAMVALPCMILSGLMEYYDVTDEDSVLLNPTNWSGFTFLVGFLVVFRTSQAYARFWDGAAATHRMRADFLGAAQALLAFTSRSKRPRHVVEPFKHMVLRLISLLFAFCLAELEGDDDDDAPPHAFDFELVDAGGIDSKSWSTVEAIHCKSALVFHWLQLLLVQGTDDGVIAVAAPLVARAEHQLHAAIAAFHDAKKIADIPFPFPYAQACDFFLILHWCLTPFITSQYSAGVEAALIFSFLQVFILWSLTNIAIEIEQPFGRDDNDLDAALMQRKLNQELLVLLHPSVGRLPVLSEDSRLKDMDQSYAEVLDGCLGSYNEVTRLKAAKLPLRSSRRSDFTGVVFGETATWSRARISFMSESMSEGCHIQTYREPPRESTYEERLHEATESRSATPSGVMHPPQLDRPTLLRSQREWLGLEGKVEAGTTPKTPRNSQYSHWIQYRCGSCNGEGNSGYILDLNVALPAMGQPVQDHVAAQGEWQPHELSCAAHAGPRGLTPRPPRSFLPDAPGSKLPLPLPVEPELACEPPSLE
eukprot:TRINITY_DN93055_c0_g1_i1.p1 TRINITY_DN93055_c0_g1~~TRINITY_DN93055_c0_g1_i1.p1  ORF type:complete len:558 (-),score=91.25 TRINITY_DN93055_c0_g1_i1:214-1887(-)